MFAKCAILLFELVFFFNTIKYNAVDAIGQGLTVRVSFLSKDQASVTFITGQLAPVFEDFSKCVKWDFHPLYPVSFYGDQQSDLDNPYVCARFYYKTSGYQLAKFYVCMITALGGEQLSQGPACASKANIDWGKVSNCTPAELGDVDPGNNLEITLNDLYIPDITTRFKDEVCNKLVSLNLSCACCH